MSINHANIFYVRDIHAIGGVPLRHLYMNLQKNIKIMI